MTLELRRVTADWQHPTSSTHNSGYRPLRRPLAEQQKWWDYGLERMRKNGVLTVAAWRIGPGPICFELLYAKPAKKQSAQARFAKIVGQRPTDDGTYMPYWTDAQATHWQLYDNFNLGTPLTPPFATIEKLADYCEQEKIRTHVICAPNQTARNIATREDWLTVFKDSVAAYDDWMHRINNHLRLHPLPGKELEEPTATRRRAPAKTQRRKTPTAQPQ